jgi:hypothetical protein
LARNTKAHELADNGSRTLTDSLTNIHELLRCTTICRNATSGELGLYDKEYVMTANELSSASARRKAGAIGVIVSAALVVLALASYGGALTCQAAPAAEAPGSVAPTGAAGRSGTMISYPILL